MATIRFEADPAFEAALAKTAEIHDYLEVLADAAADTARQLVPVGATGNLRDSIDSEVTSEGGGFVGRLVVSDFKATWIEFGTIRHPARPFIRPAIEAEVGPLRESPGA